MQAFGFNIWKYFAESCYDGFEDDEDNESNKKGYY